MISERFRLLSNELKARGEGKQYRAHPIFDHPLKWAVGASRIRGRMKEGRNEFVSLILITELEG
jgi:hypothetical protein